MAKARRSGSLAVLIGVAAASAGLIAYGAYCRDLRLARKRVAAGGALAKTRCGPIEYAATGEGPPVLVVHGAGGGFDQGLDFGRSLAERGFRIIAMSRFGYLRTPMPRDASPAAQADAHACLLEALNIRRAAVAAGSAGAPSAMQFALRHPERCSALVLLVPAAYAPREDGAPSMRAPALTGLLLETALRFDFLFWAAPRVSRALMIRGLLATPPELLETASQSERARIAETLERILPVTPRRAGLLNDAAITASLERYDLERIAAPTLVISTADDLYGTLDGARYTAEHIPGARLIEYPTGGHLWIGRHEAIAAEMAVFLKEASSNEAVPPG